MKILSFDISSSSTGWALLDSNDNETKLIDYGLVKPDSSMSIFQKLYFFGNEIKRLIERFQPDNIGIEEVVLVRGPVIMRTLASFRGVALYHAYSYQKREIITFEPPAWKKLVGLGGFARKCEIQLYICDYFKLLDINKINSYKKIIDDLIIKFNELKKAKKKNDKELLKFIEEKKNELENKIKNKNDIKKELKNVQKQFIKEKKKEITLVEQSLDKVSTDITSDCGINNDIADAIGVGISTLFKLKGKK